MTKTIKGTISITSLGAGYVFSEDIDEDVYIPSHLLNTALNGDEVEIIRHAKIEGEKLTGEVIKILSRKKLRFVGTIKVEKVLKGVKPPSVVIKIYSMNALRLS